MTMSEESTLLHRKFGEYLCCRIYLIDKNLKVYQLKCSLCVNSLYTVKDYNLKYNAVYFL